MEVLTNRLILSNSICCQMSSAIFGALSRVSLESAPQMEYSQAVSLLRHAVTVASDVLPSHWPHIIVKVSRKWFSGADTEEMVLPFLLILSQKLLDLLDLGQL